LYKVGTKLWYGFQPPNRKWGGGGTKIGDSGTKWYKIGTKLGCGFDSLWWKEETARHEIGGVWPPLGGYCPPKYGFSRISRQGTTLGGEFSNKLVEGTISDKMMYNT